MTYTAWQLRALKGKTVEVTLPNWTVEKWIVNVNQYNSVNIILEPWTRAPLLLASSMDSDSSIVDIIKLRVIEDLTEGEEVYVSDISVEDAIKNTCKKIYIYTLNNWNYIVQHPYHYNSQSDVWLSAYQYIAKVPKKEIVEMTMEQVNKALGKKIKIIE